MIRRSACRLVDVLCAGAFAVTIGCSGDNPDALTPNDSTGTDDPGASGSQTFGGGESNGGSSSSGVAGSNGAGGASSSVGGSSGHAGSTSSPDAGRDAASDAAQDRGPPPVCNYPDWVAHMHYAQGAIVMYMGKPYIATNVNDGLDPTVSTYFWSPYKGCTPPPPKPPPPPIACAALDKFAPSGQTTFQATYDAMFTPTFMGRVINPVYTYQGFCKSLDAPTSSTFARSGDATRDKRELAAFLANVAIETAYLVYSDEGGASPTLQDYHGRGSLQITGQVIYDAAGAALGLNLTGQPQLASTDPVVWETGLWYWSLHANPSVGEACHQAISAGNFGTTIRIIKGDCGSSADRVAQYQKNCSLLGVDPGNVSCP
jgi:chitinase